MDLIPKNKVDELINNLRKDFEKAGLKFYAYGFTHGVIACLVLATFVVLIRVL